MRLIDEQYLKTPFSGSRRMAACLVRRGEAVNRKRVQRLMALMGLEGLHPRPRTTDAASGARTYPYLLRGRVLSREQLLESVWGEQRYVTPRTVDVHVRRLREQIEEQPDSPRYLTTVRGFGYRFEESA